MYVVASAHVRGMLYVYVVASAHVRGMWNVYRTNA
jgi:hypothetical protein